MSLLRALILGSLQGATEFLPVSSSGHLVLVPWLLGWPAPSLAFGAITHWGTALAVIITFWADLWGIVRALAGWIAGLVKARSLRLSTPPFEARLGLLIVLGSIPAAILGYLLEDLFEEAFSRPAYVAAFLLVTAVALGLAERFGRHERALTDLKWPDALLVGLAQAAAILPGISRSGATIAAGTGRRFQPDAAARFSFLLSVPIVLGAGLFEIVDISAASGLADAWASLLVGFLASLVVGLAAVRWLMRQLRRGRFCPFAVYCAIAGAGCLVIVAVRGG